MLRTRILRTVYKFTTSSKIKCYSIFELFLRFLVKPCNMHASTEKGTFRISRMLNSIAKLKIILVEVRLRFYTLSNFF